MVVTSGVLQEVVLVTGGFGDGEVAGELLVAGADDVAVVLVEFDD